MRLPKFGLYRIVEAVTGAASGSAAGPPRPAP
jgi:hypothetical protein